MTNGRWVDIRLPLERAEALPATLEELLAPGPANADLELLYRHLGWRILAATEGTGLTATLSALARKADSLEQYEAARDEELGPILDGLERGENRDP